MRYILLLIAICLTFLSCIHTDVSLRRYVSFLEGQWTNQDSVSTSKEEWKWINDSLLQGQGFVIRQHDTQVAETMQLIKCNDRIYFIPSSLKQSTATNDSFLLQMPIKNDSLVFYNPTHDFPQYIVYHFIKPDSIAAHIDGVYEGKRMLIRFPLHKKR